MFKLTLVVASLGKRGGRRQWGTETYVLTSITILPATRNIVLICPFLTKNAHAINKNR